MFDRLSTEELKNYIYDKYILLKTLAQKEGIFEELDIYFSEGTPQNVEGSYAYSDQFGYHYEFTEKGNITSKKLSDDLFDISYWIFSDQVFKMALKYATNNRQPNQDFRRVLFAKVLELLGLLGENYRMREEIKINEVLKDNPYNDSL